MATDNIEGTATDSSGNPLQDAVIALFLTNKNASDGDINDVQYTRTDSNGNYVINDHPDADGSSQEWHVAGFYQDGTGEFNALSKPSVEANVGFATPDSGLVHRWDVDAGSGSTVTDSEGNNDGTVNGATWTTTAKSGGQALSYTTDDYVNDITGLANFNAASLIAWIRPSEISNGPYTPIMRGDSNVDFGFSLVDNTSDGTYDDVRFIWRDGPFQDAYANDQFNVDTWAMVSHTVDSTNGFDGYVDTTNVASASSSSLMYAGSSSLEWGRRTIPDQYFDGIIDGPILYYNEKKTQSEIEDIYNAFA